MARILVNELVQCLERDFAAPRTGVGRRIIHRKLVINRLFVNPSETFGHLHVLGTSGVYISVAVYLPKGKIGGLNNKRIAFPPTPRVSHPWTDVLRQRLWLTQPNNPYVVNHFGHNHDVISGLHNGVVIIVKVVGQHRGTRVRAKRFDATLTKRPIFRVVILAEHSTQR